MTCWGFQMISQPFQQTTPQVQGGEEGRTERNVPTWTGEAFVFVLINGGTKTRSSPLDASLRDLSLT